MNRESPGLTDIRDLWGITGNHGFPASGLDHWLRRFGAVPASLAEYYLALGAHKALNATFDGLIVPDDIDSRAPRTRSSTSPSTAAPGTRPRTPSAVSCSPRRTCSG